jgi:uncharacterized peroxidase-related enzyme
MFLSAPPESEDTARLYASSLRDEGFVMNLMRTWAWRADVFEAFSALRGQLTEKTSLSKRELAVLVCAAVSTIGDSYCSLAWGKLLAQAVDPDSAAAVLQGRTTPALFPRERALADWARKVVSSPNATTAADVSALRAVGLADREIAEATFFVAFRLAFSAVNDALGIEPDWQLRENAPSEIAAAVTFGRPVAAKDA